MAARKPYYTKDNPPPSCIECEWHGRTYSLSTGCHTYWYDKCDNINRHFAKMHIVLRGEYRSLSKHDEDDLKGSVLPYECPYFDASKVFWEMYGRIRMDYEMFIYECATHGPDYYNYYVYALTDVILMLQSEIPLYFNLHYQQVATRDEPDFIKEFGEDTLVLSDISPYDWEYPVPPQPI